MQVVQVVDENGRQIVLSSARMPTVDAAIAAQLGEVQVNPTSNTVLARLKDVGNALDSLDTLIRSTRITLLPLDSSTDSIDVAKKSKGAVTTTHSAITATATSAEIDCRGFNSVLVDVLISVSKNWTFKIA